MSDRMSDRLRYMVSCFIVAVGFALGFSMCSCGDNQLPSCSSLGCPDTEPLICTRSGHCGCHEEACFRPIKSIHDELGPDANVSIAPQQ
jgi:hypothetical protein